MTLDRRSFNTAALAAARASLMPNLLAADEPSPAGNLHLASFRFDVSPPKGHSLCGGWIKPVIDYDDPLEAIGLVLLGAGKPIVICAVDWTGIMNDSHLQWRTALAEAAGTTPERVAVQCVHQHNAPFVCLEAERIAAAEGDLPHIVDADFFRTCLDRARAAVGEGFKRAHPVTHVATGQAKVIEVASNRRFVGADGKINDWRGSSSRNPVHQELPEGLIDPWLKTVALYDGETKIAACHYYATHPMSYYGDGRVSSDFPGLARKRRQKEEPDCTHIYFTGASGNIAAGKYNDGSPESRVRLTGRIYDGIVASEKELRPEPIEQVDWKTSPVHLPPRDTLVAEKLAVMIHDKTRGLADRCRPAFMLAWLRRCEQKQPIILSALHLNRATLLHLPAESFVEYQLEGQELAADRFVATAAYGDGGSWYLPTKEAYPQGGYEVSVAFCDPEVDPILTDGIKPLV